MILAALLLFAAGAAPTPLVDPDERIPVMTVMANSLGVACTYCHETDWKSDAKPAKQAARQMIVMTRAINETHYGGKVVVTCNTCHHGSVATSPVPPVANAGWNKPDTIALQPPLPPAAQLFVPQPRARSGAGVVSARSGRGDPKSAPFEIADGALTTELKYPPEAPRGLAMLGTYERLTTKGIAELRGRTAYLVEAIPKDGSMPETLAFDAKSGVLLQRHRERPTSVGVLAEEYDFDDYRTVDGVLVPFLVQWSRADYQVTYRFASVGAVRRE